MFAAGIRHRTIARSGATEAAVAALVASACALDAPGLSIPRAEPHLVVRFGPKADNGLDLHVMGARQHARRKTLHGGQRVVTARLRLGLHDAVFGVPASAIAGRIVPLAALWGDASERLGERLVGAAGVHHAARLLDEAIAERLGPVRSDEAHVRLARAAARRLATARVNEVADALGVSERTLRRVFRAVVGMGPKAYARLARFHLALREARRGGDAVDWAAIAATAGYYDQSHLIAEFHAIAGATPRMLMSELRAARVARPISP